MKTIGFGTQIAPMDHSKMKPISMKSVLLLFSAVFAMSFCSSAQCAFTEVNMLSATAEWGEEMAWELYLVAQPEDVLMASFQGASDDEVSEQLLCL